MKTAIILSAIIYHPPCNNEPEAGVFSEEFSEEFL